MTNKYGLDTRYFKEKLGQLVRDAENYKPAEMSLALERLAVVADHQRLMFNCASRETEEQCR